MINIYNSLNSIKEYKAVFISNNYFYKKIKNIYKLRIIDFLYKFLRLINFIIQDSFCNSYLQKKV